VSDRPQPPVSSAASGRHPATAKAWDWFENDPSALAYTPTLRASIKQKLEEIDAQFLDGESRYPMPEVRDAD
jgi:hypothetical protein